MPEHKLRQRGEIEGERESSLKFHSNPNAANRIRRGFLTESQKAQQSRAERGTGGAQVVRNKLC